MVVRRAFTNEFEREAVCPIPHYGIRVSHEGFKKFRIP